MRSPGDGLRVGIPVLRHWFSGRESLFLHVLLWDSCKIRFRGLFATTWSSLGRFSEAHRLPKTVISLNTSFQNQLFVPVAHGLLHTNTSYRFLSSESAFWTVPGASRERAHHGCNSKKFVPSPFQEFWFLEDCKIRLRAPLASTSSSLGRFSGGPWLPKTVISQRTSFKNRLFVPVAYRLLFTTSFSSLFVSETPFWAFPEGPQERARQPWDSKKVVPISVQGSWLSGDCKTRSRAPFTFTWDSLGQFSGSLWLPKTMILLRTSLKNALSMSVACRLLFTHSSYVLLFCENPFWSLPRSL